MTLRKSMSLRRCYRFGLPQDLRRTYKDPTLMYDRTPSFSRVVGGRGTVVGTLKMTKPETGYLGVSH